MAEYGAWKAVVATRNSRPRSLTTIRFLLTTALLACSLAATAGQASAATQDGWGFGIADNVRDRSGMSTQLNSTIDGNIASIGSKIYRVQIPYDIMSKPAAADRVTQLKQGIQNARNMGVQQVLVTFCMGWDDYQAGAKWPATNPPSETIYDQQTRAVIAEFDPVGIDQWSPANEPNGGWQWLGNYNDAQGPALLAEYYKKLKAAIPAGDQIVSPEFADRADFNGNLVLASNGQPVLRLWINNYLAAVGNGDGWGSHAALHPYGAVASKNSASITEFNNLVGGAADVWFTEIGGRIEGGGWGPKYPQAQQTTWLVNYLKASTKVTRAYYYNPWDDNSSWDSALLNNDGSPREAWFSWCAASHAMTTPYAPCGSTPWTGFALSNCNDCGVVSNLIDYGLPGDIPLSGRWSTGSAPTGIGIFRPSNATFQLRNNLLVGPPSAVVHYGLGTDRPITGDWDANGSDSIGVFRGGYFYLSNSNTSGVTHHIVNFGLPGDIPIAGDWDGDGRDSIGVFRGGYFYLSNSVTSGALHHIINFGLAGDFPLAGDWNRNGRDTIGVRRSAVNYFSNTLDGTLHGYAAFGLNGDKAFVGDWNNDGMDTIGIRR